MNPLVDTRAEDWTWTLLDKFTEAPVGMLDGVSTGHLEWSVFNKIRMSGNLTWTGTSPLDWSLYRLQPTYTAVTPSGVVTWPMGVYLPSTPRITYQDGQRTSQIDLYDKLLILDQDVTESTYTVAAGTVVTDAIGTIIAAASAFNLTTSIITSAETLRTAMTWPANTSRLQMVNDLLASINYFSLWVDRQGIFQAAPYTTPLQRGPAWAFADDQSSIYTPNIENEQDLFNVPNKIVLVTTGDDTTAALTSTATNMNPLSKSSYPARGRWITIVDTNVTATSQVILDAMAARRLAEASMPQSTLTINHAHLPLDLNNTVTFTSTDAARLGSLGVVQSMTVDTVPGSLTQSRLLEVIT